MEPLNRSKVLFHVKLRKDDDLITTERAGMADSHQRVNMAHGEQAQCHIVVLRNYTWWIQLLTIFVFSLLDLEGVGNDVSVGDLHSFLP